MAHANIMLVNRNGMVSANENEMQFQDFRQAEPHIEVEDEDQDVFDG